MYDHRSHAGRRHPAGSFQLRRIINSIHNAWHGPSDEYKHEEVYVSIIMSFRRHYFHLTGSYDSFLLAMDNSICYLFSSENRAGVKI